MKIKESGEMYLETILRLSQTQNVVRAVDIAETMNYSKPSVSRALNILKANDYILVDVNGHIALTSTGEKIAKTIYERHEVLSKVFIAIGVDEKTAVEDACRIEHYISDTTFQALKNICIQNCKKSD